MIPTHHPILSIRKNNRKPEKQQEGLGWGSGAQRPENRRQNSRSVWVGEGIRRGISDLRVPPTPCSGAPSKAG